eukprot:6477898-Amphidinium_carterae.1
MSLTLFTPRFPWKLKQYFPELERLGFPVSQFVQAHGNALEQHARSQLDVLVSEATLDSLVHRDVYVSEDKRPLSDEGETSGRVRKKRITASEKEQN